MPEAQARDRRADVARKTLETDIRLSLGIDGTGVHDVQTGIGFFDHMLGAFAKHGFFDLTLTVKGDLEVDGHHTVEDTGLVLGQAFSQAVGDKGGIGRFGTAYVPMDEALVMAVVDFSGRPYLDYGLQLGGPMVGSFDTSLVQEFYRSLTNTAGINLHIRQLAGQNDHHIVEASFKAVARALDDGTRMDARIRGVLSTKGSL